MGDVTSTATAGIDWRGYRRGTQATDSTDQYVVPVRDRIVSCDGRVTSFSTPGRAAVDQKLIAIENRAASPVLMAVQHIRVDIYSTVVKAVTVVAPIIRVVKYTPNATNGTALTKTPLDSTQTSSASVVVTGDASSDNTSSATTLTLTAGASVSQVYAPRLLSAVGYELVDYAEFFAADMEIILRAGEGLAVFLTQATVTTGNPATDRWLATIDWQEFTRP